MDPRILAGKWQDFGRVFTVRNGFNAKTKDAKAGKNPNDQSVPVTRALPTRSAFGLHLRWISLAPALGARVPEGEGKAFECSRGFHARWTRRPDYFCIGEFGLAIGPVRRSLIVRLCCPLSPVRAAPSLRRGLQRWARRSWLRRRTVRWAVVLSRWYRGGELAVEMCIVRIRPDDEKGSL